MVQVCEPERACSGCHEGWSWNQEGRTLSHVHKEGAFKEDLAYIAEMGQERSKMGRRRIKQRWTTRVYWWLNPKERLNSLNMVTWSHHWSLGESFRSQGHRLVVVIVHWSPGICDNVIIKPLSIKCLRSKFNKDVILLRQNVLCSEKVRCSLSHVLILELHTKVPIP